VTSSTDTDPHPDVAEISALTEGLLDPDRSAEVRGHLASCALCADVYRSFDEIRGLLGTLPSPARMPADIAGRIEAALAAEALLDSTAPSAVSRETEPDAETRHVSRETAPTPSTPRTEQRSDGHARGSTGPGRRPQTRRRWRAAVFGAACALAAIGLGGVLIQTIDTSDSGSSPNSAAANKPDTQKDSSGLSARGLESRVQKLLSGADTKAAPSNEVGADSNQPMRGSDATVPACVREGIGRADSPIASEQGRYEGAEVYLVVLPHSSDAARVDAYVVDASCAAKTPQGPGDVLLRRVYQRS
jgi:hypothetical protein